MLYGARVSLAVGFVSVGIASLIGVVLGSLAGYNGGLVDGATMRLVDLMLVFPRFFLLLAVLAFLRPSIWTIMAVIGLTGWMGVARGRPPGGPARQGRPGLPSPPPRAPDGSFQSS